MRLQILFYFLQSSDFRPFFSVQSNRADHNRSHRSHRREGLRLGAQRESGRSGAAGAFCWHYYSPGLIQRCLALPEEGQEIEESESF